ncbi:MAG: hypothetical protein GC192_18790 [Bacteroidetes bacterium]|nr:hypothetical protein [Bacteroidota bacterium]
MKTHFCYLLVVMVFFIACHADPGIISDDDMTPILPAAPLECDSLFAPNNVFPENIGNFLVFVDSIGNEFDTLQCVKNEAFTKKIVEENSPSHMQYCLENYTIAYSTNWLQTDFYSLEINFNKAITETYTAQSVPFNDFYSNFRISDETSSTIYDSLLINGILFQNVMLFNCNSNKPCTFVEAIAAIKGVGLIAYKRQDKWWTKI